MLTHPNIVSLYDSGEVGGQLFYVMPYIAGESLRQRLNRETMLPVDQVLAWTMEVGEGLSFAHGHGIIHRDIKPENLLIQADHLLIADFGIARAIDLAAGEAITSEELVLGTPLYMSPEQASGMRLDGRSDIYSLGCVVYEMLSGEPPFKGPTPQAITAKKLSGRYPPVQIVRSTIPEEVDRTLQRALMVNAADRFQTVDEFCASLRKAAKPKASHRSAWLLTIGLVGAVAALVGEHVREAPHPASQRPRVVVGPFDNRTGDSRHEPLGFMASDWVTEGLQRTGSVDVVPTLTAVGAMQFLRQHPDSSDPVRALARETGATLVVTGSLYRDHDTLTIQAQLANAADGRLVGAVEPLRIPENNWVRAVQEVRTRLMGLLQLSLDDRILRGEPPPTYASYQSFGEGLNAYAQSDFDRALPAFQQAYTADTSFALPLLYASFCYANVGKYAAADSVLAIVAKQRDRLTPYHKYLLDYQRAELAGKDAESLLAIRHAAELAPTSKATYNFAVRALEARQPFPAESALRLLSPDVGAMRDWLPYWDVLASALHVQGKHQQELKTARQARSRFPDRAGAMVLEGRALAARGKLRDLERLWAARGQLTQPRGADIGAFAYEIGSELQAHGESNASAVWFQRAFAWFSKPAAPDDNESRWGRARAATALGRLPEALELLQRIDTADEPSPDQLGVQGILMARTGSLGQAQQIVQRLAADTRPYSYGRPQFQAARIAIVLGQLRRGIELLEQALTRGYPYDLEFHRDESLTQLRDLPIWQQLDIRRN
jgi:TolB-like protein/tetratricopeptide (TPR) repeat protein